MSHKAPRPVRLSAPAPARAPGGTGKTFLINLILAKVRPSGHVAQTHRSTYHIKRDDWTLQERFKVQHRSIRRRSNVSRPDKLRLNFKVDEGEVNVVGI